MNNTLHHKYYFIYIHTLDKPLVEYITLDDNLYKKCIYIIYKTLYLSQ